MNNDNTMFVTMSVSNKDQKLLLFI